MIKEIIKSCCQEIEMLPGFYRDFHLLWESVNEHLREQGVGQITEETLSDIILKEYPGAKFQENYLYDNEDKNLHFSSPKVVRIVFPKEIRTLSDEEKSSLQVQISNIIMTSIGYSDGWYDMSEFSVSLAEAGFSYKILGFENLSSLLLATFDEYKKENRGVDDKHPHYYWFVDIKKYATEKLKIKQEKSPKNENKLNKKGKMSAFEKLMNFAVFLSFNEAITQLAEKSLKEHWYYGGKDSGKYPILKNYLLLTFERLLAEDAQNINNEKWSPKILVNEKYAVFNTGLVDHLYEPIYALFRKNKSGKNNAPNWFFSSFVGSNDIDRQTLTREFGVNLPMPAHYYNSTSELVYDIHSQIGSLNWDHFIDHCDRLPEEFLRDYGPKFNWNRPHGPHFFKELAQAIKDDTRSFNRIKGRIEEAIKFAQKRVRWNFKTAIPIYYPGQKQISLLLPLSLTDEDKIDIALVLESTENGAYIAHTILTLEMAYTNARLITRPDSDWLTADSISESVDGIEVDNVTKEPAIERNLLSKDGASALSPSFNPNDNVIVETDDNGIFHAGNIMLGLVPNLLEGSSVKLQNIWSNTNAQYKSLYPYFSKPFVVSPESIVSAVEEIQPSVKEEEVCRVEIDQFGNKHVGNIYIAPHIRCNENSLIYMLKYSKNNSPVIDKNVYPYWANLVRQIPDPSKEPNMLGKVREDGNVIHVGNIVIEDKNILADDIIRINELKVVEFARSSQGIFYEATDIELVTRWKNTIVEVEIDEQGKTHVGTILIPWKYNCSAGDRIQIVKTTDNLYCNVEPYLFVADPIISAPED